MATSNSWDYGLTAAGIIQAAYEDLGVITPGGTPRPTESAMALARLNMVVKQYQGLADGAQGLKIHTRQRITLLLEKGRHSYLIGPGTTHAKASTLVGKTTLSGAEAAGQFMLSITSNADATSYPGTTLTMAPADAIGVLLDDGTIHWATVGSGTASVVNITAALPSGASSGNAVWWFTSKAQRFPTLEAAVMRTPNFEDSPLEIYTDVREYELGVSSKLAAGTPQVLLVEPLRTATRIIFDAAPTDVTQTVVLTVLYPSEDYDALTDDIAYPQEALRFLSWELAFALSTSFGHWTPQMEQNRKEARAMYMTLNPDNSVLHFQPGGE